MTRILPEKGGSFIILGAGHFGRRALEKIFKKDPQANIRIVDKDPLSLESIENDRRVKRVLSDGIEFLAGEMNKEDGKEWIIPAIPVHVAFEFAMLRLRSACHVERRPIPEAMDLPNPIIGKDGNLYVSYADFLCPDDCPEPVDRCFKTAKERGIPLFERIGRIHIPDYSVKVIRSHQIAPGLGGYPAKELNRLIREIEGEDGGFLIGTACRCHGVVSALWIKGTLSEVS